mmetsp:Transcript_109938/g.354995  ORF Transcript_109938/g.354995 Transcript_109938/m.354995 type:complete len:260 (-) Transcript_109938:612-1391(-)
MSSGAAPDSCHTCPSSLRAALVGQSQQVHPAMQTWAAVILAQEIGRALQEQRSSAYPPAMTTHFIRHGPPHRQHSKRCTKASITSASLGETWHCLKAPHTLLSTRPQCWRLLQPWPRQRWPPQRSSRRHRLQSRLRRPVPSTTRRTRGRCNRRQRTWRSSESWRTAWRKCRQLRRQPRRRRRKRSSPRARHVRWPRTWTCLRSGSSTRRAKTWQSSESWMTMKPWPGASRPQHTRYWGAQPRQRQGRPWTGSQHTRQGT